MGITVDGSKVSLRLTRISKGFDKEVPLLIKDIAGIFSISMRDNFESRNAGKQLVDGGWKELKDSTIRDRKRKGYQPGPILVRSGKMKKSIRPNNVRKYSAEVGSFDVDYAHYHQKGNKRLPARKFIGATKDGIKSAEGRIQRFGRKILTGI